jgi:hypothetical protein
MNILKNQDIVVFGVTIPGLIFCLNLNRNYYYYFFSYIETDGKAGMAVILDDPSAPIDMNTLGIELKKQGLPSYARPCFIRLTKHIELTG